MMATSSIEYGIASDIGLQRTENQDAVGSFPRDSETIDPRVGRLFIVADGMGGHLGGREASRVAVEEIAAYYFSAPDRDPGRRLFGAVASANQMVFHRAQERDELHGMGTTCTAMAIVDGKAWFAHVGDSRAYRSDGNRLSQLTTDHTHVQELVRMELLSEAEAAHHPQRHVLTRSLGMQSDLEVDLLGPVSLHDGERYLLCTDGLAGVGLKDIHETLLRMSAAEASARLIEMANAAGGSDNTSVVVVHITHASGNHKRRWWSLGH